LLCDSSRPRVLLGISGVAICAVLCLLFAHVPCSLFEQHSGMHEFILHLGFLLTLEFKQPSYLTVYIKALDEKEMCI